MREQIMNHHRNTFTCIADVLIFILFAQACFCLFMGHLKFMHCGVHLVGNILPLLLLFLPHFLELAG